MRPSLVQYRTLLATYLGPQRWSVVLLAALIVGTTALQLAGPQVLRRFIDAAQAGDTTQALLVIAALFLGVALVTQAVTVAATYWSERIGWHATNALRADLALHCLQLDMPFHHQHTPGEMIERIDGDVTALANFFGQFVIQIIGNLLLLVGVLAVLFWEDWRIGAALAVFSVITMVVLVRTRNLAVPAFEAAQQSEAELYGFLEERLAGIDDIRANGAGAYMVRRFHHHARNRFRLGRTAEIRGASLWSISTTLFACGYVVALGLGIWLYLGGTFTIGAVYLIFQYTALLQRPLAVLTDQLQDLQRAGAGVVRVGALFGMQPQLVDGQRELPTGPLAVALNEVGFSYGEEPVLDAISFGLQPGEVLGLLGRTGAGKTTLTRLLLRLYDANAGTVTLNGIDVPQLRLDTLRERIGVVTQEVHLFAGTLRDNLALFDSGIDDQRMLDALHALGLRPWFDTLPNGLDTELAAGGAGVSAGQAQLLALTRAFLRDPGLVILDEASSRLDPATEELLQHAIDRLLHGRTAIIIAHRLRTVQRANTIMLLENGHVAEYGPRATLANDPDSRFAALLRTGLEEVLA